MTNISRRSLIKGMAALPLAQHMFSEVGEQDSCPTGAVAQKHVAEPQCENCNGMSVKNLVNVIFHGLFIFVARAGKNGGVEVLTPSVPEHVYGGGNWYEEYRLRADAYTLALPRRKHSPQSLPDCQPGCKDRIVIPKNIA